MDEWGWRERGRESAKERYYWRDGREEGRFGYTNKGRRKGGRPGDRAGLGRIQAFPSKFEFAWEKKGGEERWTGVSAGGYGRYQGTWPEPRQTRKPMGWLAKRRSVTVTGNDGLNSIREAQDEASRIGTKPSGVMTR